MTAKEWIRLLIVLTASVTLGLLAFHVLAEPWVAWLVGQKL
jgi:hypothetical protein